MTNTEIERLDPESCITYCSYQQHANRYAFVADFVKNKTVLDIACGIGYGSNFLVEKGGAKCVIGGDISDKAIKDARLYYKKDSLQFVKLDGTRLPFIDNYFDIIISMETIEHIAKYRKFLCECRRILKDGGIIVCSTPNKEFSFTSNPYHIKEFYAEEFFSVINEYFTEIERYGQVQINEKEIFKLKMINFGIKFMDNIPVSIRDIVRYILNVLKTFIFREYKTLQFKKICEEMLDKKYAIYSLKDMSWKISIILAKKK